MKNISLSSRTRGYKPEIIETEIGDWKSRHTLLRHMSVPETKSHRGRNVGNTDYAPRTCQINADEQNQAKIAANIALGILQYQLSDRSAQQKHLENVYSKLEHRLQVAKSQGNSQLLNILQNEYRELETNI